MQGTLALGRDIEAPEANFDAGVPDLAEHHADGGAFAGAIVAQQAENLALRHDEIKVLDRALIAKDFLDVFELDHWTVPCISRRFLMCWSA